ncbi:hypothetical protein ACLOJK_009964 [Asimina triloba]
MAHASDSVSPMYELPSRRNENRGIAMKRGEEPPAAAAAAAAVEKGRSSFPVDPNLPRWSGSIPTPTSSSTMPLLALVRAAVPLPLFSISLLELIPPHPGSSAIQ